MGRVTLAEYHDLSGEPQPKIAQIEGPFRAVGEMDVRCLRCGEPPATASQAREARLGARSVAIASA